MAIFPHTHDERHVSIEVVATRDILVREYIECSMTFFIGISLISFVNNISGHAIDNETIITIMLYKILYKLFV